MIFFFSFIASSELPSHNILRQRRSVSESTRFHNEYDRSDLRGHRTKNNLDTPAENCIPGTRWKQDCNSCWCSESGVAACTFMACLHLDDKNNGLTNSHQRQPTFRHTVSRNSIQEHGDKHTRERRSDNDSDKCIPGARWKQDCNSCWCTETGISACTLMGCLHFDDKIQRFDPPTSNRRKRSSSGTTRHPNSWPGNEEKCTHGMTWMNKCNRCRCFKGHAACTRMMCVEKEGVVL